MLRFSATCRFLQVSWFSNLQISAGCAFLQPAEIRNQRRTHREVFTTRSAIPLLYVCIPGKGDFKAFISLAVKNSVFLFDSKYYKQDDGVAMGSPLGPTMANAFLAFHERKWLADCPSEFRPVLFRRYVDDCFVLFRHESHADLFLQYLNLCHPSMQFTVESESEGKMPFLDMLISRPSGSFTTSVYRKPTFSGVYSNFDSFIPKSFSSGLISGLLYRSYNLSSTWAQFHSDVQVLKSVLAKNSYPMDFINDRIRRFVDKMMAAGSDRATRIVQDERLVIPIVLPYTGLCSIQVKSRICKLFSRYMPHVNVRIVFKSSHRISSLFPYKDRIPFALRSGVVYKFTCGGCNAPYYGQTGRHLATRISEHTGISARTGNNIVPKDSAIHDHLMNCKLIDRAVSPRDFSVLASASNSFHLLVKESILIARDKPILNRQIASLPLELL
jgi:hypothetical protein